MDCFDVLRSDSKIYCSRWNSKPKQTNNNNFQFRQVELATALFDLNAVHVTPVANALIKEFQQSFCRCVLDFRSKSNYLIELIKCSAGKGYVKTKRISTVSDCGVLQSLHCRERRLRNEVVSVSEQQR